MEIVNKVVLTKPKILYSLHLRAVKHWCKKLVMMPCELTKYQVQEYRKYEVEYLTDPMLKNQLKEFNDSKASLILINHQKAETILQHEEILEYDAYKFISDSGNVSLDNYF